MMSSVLNILNVVSFMANVVELKNSEKVLSWLMWTCLLKLKMYENCSVEKLAFKWVIGDVVLIFCSLRSVSIIFMIWLKLKGNR